MQKRLMPEVTVGDDAEEVCIRNIGDGKVVLVVGDHCLREVSIGLLRSLHHAAGAYLELTQ